MKNKAFLYASYAGLLLSLTGIALGAKRSNRMMICSPMMDDGIAKPIMGYAQKHPGVTITKELGDQILRGEVN